MTIFACVPYFLHLMSRRGLSLGRDCARNVRALYFAGGGVSDSDHLGQAPLTRGSGFVTTDLGVTDAYGNLSITGRISEMMNFRGNRVSVVSVEAMVMKIPGVLDARLRPAPGDEDAQCTLHVVPTADAQRDNLRMAIIRAVTPKGLIREIAFVEHWIRRGPAKRSDELRSRSHELRAKRQMSSARSCR